jgi:hypothetical protein
MTTVAIGKKNQKSPAKTQVARNLHCPTTRQRVAIVHMNWLNWNFMMPGFNVKTATRRNEKDGRERKSQRNKGRSEREQTHTDDKKNAVASEDDGIKILSHLGDVKEGFVLETKVMETIAIFGINVNNREGNGVGRIEEDLQIEIIARKNQIHWTVRNNGTSFSCAVRYLTLTNSRNSSA